MIELENIYLLASAKDSSSPAEQITIRFNPQVANYTYNISESKTDTLGSIYPFVKRTGKTKYRTFSIDGLITHFMNTKEDLANASKEKLYGDSVQLY
jgi:hypothetical protein